MTKSSFYPEWAERTVQLIGLEAFERLRQANVIVAGMGGVGAMAAEMICRSGVGKMTIVDADTIQPSNINRQIPATHNTVGEEKVQVMGRRLKEINPELELTVLNEFMHEESILEILEQPFDYVVDAIDSLTPKIFLIYHTLEKGYKLTASMGSGGKVDPSQIRVTDFGKTYNCRLAYNLRKKLRKMGVEGGFPVVFSAEQVDKELIIPVEDEPNKKSTVGTLSYIPAIFGCTLASVVVNELAKLSPQ